MDRPTKRTNASSRARASETSAPTLSRLARVRVLSVPSGARILDDGADLGAAPQDVAFRPGLMERVLRVELAGYMPREIVISRTTPSPYTVTLQPIGRRTAPTQPKPTLKSPTVKKPPRASKPKRPSAAPARKKRPGYEIW